MQWSQIFAVGRSLHAYITGIRRRLTETGSYRIELGFSVDITLSPYSLGLLCPSASSAGVWSIGLLLGGRRRGPLALSTLQFTVYNVSYTQGPSPLGLQLHVA